MSTGTAELVGDKARPLVYVRFSYGVRHPVTGKTLQDWARDLPGRRWNPDVSAWEVNSFGKNPERVLADAGFELILPDDGPLAGLSLNDLYTPLGRLDDNKRTVRIIPRLCGTKGVQELVENCAVWDKTEQLLRIPAIDVINGASPRAGIAWSQDAIDAARAAHESTPLLHPSLAPALSRMSSALTPQDVKAEMLQVREHLDERLTDFGVELYPYQVVGPYAIAGGHTLLADSPGVGKTYQSIAATKLMGAEAILVLCPPLVVTNWSREIIAAGIATADDIAIFRQGRKAPVIDGKKVVIVSDSTLASRRALIFHLSAWMHNVERAVVLYDEAHRMKTIGAKRADAVLDLMSVTPHARGVAITGTPVLAGPHELVNLLQFTGHLAPVFGGAGPFLTRYCRKDHHGGFHPRKANLEELNRRLNEHVWVRRTKADVLPFLPERHITAVELDVDLKGYRESHRDVIEQIAEWFTKFRDKHNRWPTTQEIEEFAKDNLRFASQMCRAAGLTKVPAAVEMVSEWVKGNPDEPVILWAHHQEVIAALVEAARKMKVKTATIDGQTSHAQRTKIVDDFQAGRIPVLLCSITAAGVGITLTRSSTSLFVESNWTPALMLQAIDRQHRIGQTSQVTAEILLALGTLDEHIQGTLASKGETLHKILGDDSNSVAIGGDRELMNLKDVMQGLVSEAVKQLGVVPHSPVH